MKKKILFIASLADKKNHFDGERNKSSAIYKGLEKEFKVDTINLTKNKVLQMLKLIFLCVFKRYDLYFVSKAPLGGLKAISIMKKLGIKSEKIVFYLIGFGLFGYEDKADLNLLKVPKIVIVESEIIKEDFINKGIQNILVFPCVKEFVPLVEEEMYLQKKILNLVFYSRVVEAKGIFDIIEAIKTCNQNEKRFNLTIAGGCSEKETEAFINKEINDGQAITYLGGTLNSSLPNAYEILSKFDLHVFPSKFFHECIPGSIVDFFVAGVPTLTSRYPAYKDLISDEWGYSYEYKNVNDLISKLNYIYDNQYELFLKREKCLKRADLYSIDSFLKFFKEAILKSYE